MFFEEADEVLAGDAAVLAARDAIAPQAAGVEPLAHRAWSDFTDFRDLSGGKDFLHGRHSLTCFAESSPGPADAGPAEELFVAWTLPRGRVGGRTVGRAVPARRRAGRRDRQSGAAFPAPTLLHPWEGGEGGRERPAAFVFRLGCAKDRQAALPIMRKRPQPREVLPVRRLAPVPPTARIAARDSRAGGARNHRKGLCFAREDRTGTGQERGAAAPDVANGGRRSSVPLTF